jgi:hypothetical protein
MPWCWLENKDGPEGVGEGASIFCFNVQKAGYMLEAKFYSS